MNIPWKKIAVVSVIVAAPLLVAGSCGSHANRNAQKVEKSQQGAISQQMTQNQPLPQFQYSQLRQNLIEVETAQAQGVQTTSFFFNLGQQDPIQSCPSIGAPIATTQQLSNPTQVEHHNADGGGNVSIGQMEPNGTYTGDSAGTYVMCIGGNGQPYADYWEGYVQTVFAPAVWDYNKHQLQVTGPATFRFTRTR